MCGILALFNDGRRFNGCKMRAALDTIRHRGPDAVGIWREDASFVGHRRLSIIDLDTGNQPMQTADGRFVIAFNGEIYNFLELRDILSSHGAILRTRSDTEVILEGFRLWGPDVVHHLNGMFAFIILDRNERAVFAARDRLGIKPLCWANAGGTLIVSSTLEPFRRLSGFNRIDHVALRDLMTFDYIPAPRTIIQGVRKLEPGSRFEWRFGFHEPKIERYWSPPQAESNSAAPDEYELETLLERAVRRQMISDVPLGAFLSGGVDSSLLVALMARHSEKPVRTFSVAFAEGDADESAIAEVVARRFGTDHTVLHAEEQGPDELLELIARLDEPFCDPAFVPTFMLSALTKQHVKVALSGDGGDEVFGGYPKYLLGQNGYLSVPLPAAFHRMLRVLPWKPRQMRRVYWRTLSSADQIRFSWAHYGDFPVFRKDLRQLLSRAYHEAADIKNYFEPWENRAKRYGEKYDIVDIDMLMRTDIETYLSENCLVKTDRASMLASLEVRVPYLDEIILDRILPLPAKAKVPDGQLKALLMPIARRLLPREVWDRPKHGFSVPLDLRMAEAWRPAVKAALEWGNSNVDLFDYSYLGELYRMSYAERGVGRELWNPFVFLAWAMGRGLRN